MSFKFAIKSRRSGDILFEAELDASFENHRDNIKLGAAMKLARKADADVTGADLTGADLARANLGRVNFTGANLTGANLGRTYLARANLTGADLTGANLSGAYLADVNLTDADLTGADFTDANLTGVYLTGAKLARADLARANLTNANFSDADLADAYLTGAIWRDGVTITKAPLQIHGLGWAIYVLDTHMQVGCELHTHDDWADFDDRRVLQMEGRAGLVSWRAHREALLALCASHAPAMTEEADAYNENL